VCPRRTDSSRAENLSQLSQHLLNSLESGTERDRFYIQSVIGYHNNLSQNPKPAFQEGLQHGTMALVRLSVYSRLFS